MQRQDYWDVNCKTGGNPFQRSKGQHRSKTFPKLKLDEISDLPIETIFVKQRTGLLGGSEGRLSKENE